MKPPTQNIVNFTKVLQKRLSQRLEKVEKEYLGYIMDSALRMLHTTDDLLQFSSINSEKIHVEEFAPQEILENVVKDLAQNIKAKGANLHIGDLPEKIQGDKHLLHLVFQNLIANGIKFVPKDAAPAIAIQYEKNEGNYVFANQPKAVLSTFPSQNR